MLSLNEETKVYLFRSATDMRKGFDSLAALVSEQISKRELTSALFVFLSRRRDRVKILKWDDDGYVLYYKRLEVGVFRVQQCDGYEQITGVDLKLLLSGMELKRIKLRKKVKENMFFTEDIC